MRINSLYYCTTLPPTKPLLEHPTMTSTASVCVPPVVDGMVMAETILEDFYSGDGDGDGDDVKRERKEREKSIGLTY